MLSAKYAGIDFKKDRYPGHCPVIVDVHSHKEHQTHGKTTSYGEDARRRFKVATDTLAQAVKTSLGPKGRNVALDKKWGAPTVTHDGVTVAKEVELSERWEKWARTFVFGRGAHDKLWYCQRNGIGWQERQSLGEDLTGDPAAWEESSSGNGEGLISCMVLRQSDELWLRELRLTRDGYYERRHIV